MEGKPQEIVYSSQKMNQALDLMQYAELCLYSYLSNSSESSREGVGRGTR